MRATSILIHEFVSLRGSSLKSPVPIETSSNNEKSVIEAVERNAVICSPELSLKDATVLMYARHCSSIIVVMNGSPVGIWTEADSLKVDFSDPNELEQPISTVMSSSLHTISTDMSLDDAALKLKRHAIRHLIVVDKEGLLFGILSQSDVVTHQDAEYFLSMTEIGSIMPKQMPPQLQQSASLQDAVNAMRLARSDSLIVTQQGEPTGLISERDLVRLIAQGRINVTLADVMSKPLIGVPQTMSLLATRSLMEKRHIRHMGVNDSQGKLIGLISFSDILTNIEHTYVSRLRTVLASQSADLRATTQHLHMAHTLIEASMDGIMVTNEQGIIQSINPAFSILTGYSEAEAIGQPASLISSGIHDASFYEKMWDEINSQGRWQGEIWNRRKSGEAYPEWLTITRIKEPHTRRTLYAGIFSDITERKKSEQIIENLAYYDPLTKLPNRQLLFDRLDVALANAHRENERIALMFIDLDHFKKINDSLGHTVGDNVLIEVTKRLKAATREGDTLARIGGDELILLLTEVHDSDIVFRAAQRMSECMKENIDVDDNKLFVTSSIGCAIYPEDGKDREALLRNADTAMYRAKQAGRNTFRLYSSEMNALSHERLKMENRLRTALNNKRFFLEYQPKQSLITNQIIGVEALIRWQDEELGLIRPDQFIPLAEDLGLIDEIGSWVLHESAQQSKSWQQQGLPPLQVSVNVSARQFKNRDLINHVENALASAGLAANLLDIEITESCLMDDLESVQASLKYLRNKGVSISIDDFGTGFSSLNLLNQLPLDCLKIDRSFMQGIPGKPENEVLVSTIILMAHNLGLKVVAEGVETQEQRQFLQELNCDQIQGYYFSRPVSADQIVALVSA